MFDVFDSDFCVCALDVIGLVTAMSEVREYVRDGNITKMIVFELTDHRCVLCLAVSIHGIFYCFRGSLTDFYVLPVVRLNALCLGNMLHYGTN